MPVFMTITPVFISEKVIAHRSVGDENVRDEDGLGGGRLTGACL